MPPSNNKVHAKFIAEMQGQTMHVPNMLAMFRNWPHCGRNKYYWRLKAKLDEVMEKYGLPLRHLANLSLDNICFHLHANPTHCQKRLSRPGQAATSHEE